MLRRRNTSVKWNLSEFQFEHIQYYLRNPHKSNEINIGRNECSSALNVISDR